MRRLRLNWVHSLSLSYHQEGLHGGTCQLLEGLEFRMGFILESLRFPFNFYRNTNAPLPAACLSLVDAGRICACYDKHFCHQTRTVLDRWDLNWILVFVRYGLQSEMLLFHCFPPLPPSLSVRLPYISLLCCMQSP